MTQDKTDYVRRYTETQMRQRPGVASAPLAYIEWMKIQEDVNIEIAARLSHLEAASAPPAATATPRRLPTTHSYISHEQKLQDTYDGRLGTKATMLETEPASPETACEHAPPEGYIGLWEPGSIRYCVKCQERIALLWTAWPSTQKAGG